MTGRLSTTVDAALLESARKARAGLTDSASIDDALAALMARQRAAEFDAAAQICTALEIAIDCQS